MSIDPRRLTFPLRIASSLRDRAQILAAQDGISLNHFISLAVAEKISRIERPAFVEQHTTPPEGIEKRKA